MNSGIRWMVEGSMLRFFTRAFLIGVSCVIGAATMAADAIKVERNDPLAEPDFLPVHEAYVFSSRLDDGHVVGRWDIADGYYLYRHRFDVTPSDGVTLGELVIPDGLQKVDDFFGEVEVYYDAVEVRAPVVGQSARGFTVAFGFQGCADLGLCYPPDENVATFGDAAAETSTNAPSNGAGAGAALMSGGGPGVDSADPSFLFILLSALLGGMILNLMPCVFPVLSIKALSVVNADGASERMSHALGYTAGVVATFVALGALLLVLKALGQSVGWGFQLQSPGFITFLAILFFALGLNLLGVLEIPGFGIAMEKPNPFATGVLAVIVATPCTVPFMGAALGYGLSQSGITMVAVMLFLGLGMAAPYLALTLIPQLANRLPRPGAWMVTFKQVMAFPLFLTVVWLVWVLTRQAGPESTAIVLAACTAFGFLAWLAMGRAKRLPAVWVGGVVVAALSIVSLPEAADAPAAGDGFDMAAIEARVAGGEPVFINFTAAWCITCLANDRSTLSTDRVQAFFDDNGVAYLKADWTNADPAITTVLERFGRSGVPLYVYLPVDGEPVVLPQILTPGIVIDTVTDGLEGAVVAQR